MMAGCDAIVAFVERQKLLVLQGLQKAAAAQVDACVATWIARLPLMLHPADVPRAPGKVSVVDPEVALVAEVAQIQPANVDAARL